MKKILISIVLCLCMVFAFGVTACGDKNDECTHTWDSGTLNNGILTRTCTKCEEVVSENKTATYKAVCQDIADSVYALGGATPTAVKSFNEVAFYSTSGIYKDASAFDYIQIKAVICFVEMLAQMIDNPNFNLTSAPVKFTYSYEAHGETGEATLMYTFDEENDKVVMYWLVDSTTASTTRSVFLYMNINYNFAEQSLESFVISSEQTVGTTMNLYFGYLYENSVLKVTDSTANLTAFKGGVDYRLDELLAKNEQIIDLQADFSAEYTAMMDKMNPQ